MIRGMHAMFHCSQAEALRAFLRDKLRLAGTDGRAHLLLLGLASFATNVMMNVKPAHSPG